MTMTPAWILDAFAALMLVVAAVSAARLAVARPWRRDLAAADADMSHLLMAVAMAGMLAPGLNVAPDAAWEVVFGLMTAWFAWRAWHGVREQGVRALAAGHCAPHLVHGGAMLYMYLALTGGSGSMMPTLAYPTLAFAFTLALLGYSAVDLDQLPGLWHGPSGAGLPSAPARVPAMTAAGSAAAASSGRPAAGRPVIADASLVTLSGRAAPGAAGRGQRARALLLAPGAMASCRIAMGITMALMLVIMI